MRPVGLFCEHPLQAILHADRNAVVSHQCPKCPQQFTGSVREVLDAYREHVWDAHLDLLEDCGCCGGSHFPEFDGDCREDWERF
jgi:hypothetical protein